MTREWWTIRRSMYESGEQLRRDVQSDRAAKLRAHNKMGGHAEEMTFPIEQEAQAEAYAEACTAALGFEVLALRTTRGLI